MERAKGILYAALSSSTFGLAPLFTLLLLGLGYSSFEVLSYRWGVASLFLGALALLAGRSFRLSWPELRTVFFLSLFRAATSLSLVIAYQHIASGVASTIHFMYPLAVALAMMCFFREKGSVWVFAAIGMSIVGAVLLSLGNVDFSHGDTTLGIVSATVSVVRRMVPLGQADWHSPQAMHLLRPSASWGIVSVPQKRSFILSVARFSGYCSVIFGVTNSLPVTLRPVSRVRMP